MFMADCMALAIATHDAEDTELTDCVDMTQVIIVFSTAVSLVCVNCEVTATLVIFHELTVTTAVIGFAIPHNLASA